MTILRIGHRIKRDKRITTHLALVARALGARRMIIAGEKDDNIIKSVEKVVSEWGGDFFLDFIKDEDWKTIVKTWKEENKLIIHLTMYGKNIEEFQKSNEFFALKDSEEALKNVLIVVGGKKVPKKIFKLVDWNIGISNQPHSEVASLAIFLEKLVPNSLVIQFPNSKRQIDPSIKGEKKYYESNKS
ncbi:MAG: tRNA (cytidine(56)-2'-O)-methyltransferase [Candidatus Hodarchaeales archaeon]